MKDYGIIGDTVSILNADKLGFDACFFVMIRTSEHDLKWQENFLQALKIDLKCKRPIDWRVI